MTTTDLPVKCSKCLREIPNGAIFRDDPKGWVCEYCPEFNNEVIQIIEHPPQKEGE